MSFWYIISSLVHCHCLEKFWKRLFYLRLLQSLKNFIVDDYSLDDDFVETKSTFKGNFEWSYHY